MQKVIINAQPRDPREKPKQLFKQDVISGIAYDTVGNTRNIKIDDTRISNVLAKITYSTIVELRVGGAVDSKADSKSESKGELAIISEVQRDKRTNKPYHISFLILDPDKSTRVDVNLVLTGESPAVKNNLGVLLTTLDTIEIKGKPVDIPESLSVDISGLKDIGDTVYVRDIKLPAGLELLRDEDKAFTVATVRPFEEIVEETPAEVTEEAIEGAEGGQAKPEGEEGAEGESGEGKEAEASPDANAGKKEDKK